MLPMDLVITAQTSGCFCPLRLRVSFLHFSVQAKAAPELFGCEALPCAPPLGERLLPHGAFPDSAVRADRGRAGQGQVRPCGCRARPAPPLPVAASVVASRPVPVALQLLAGTS